MASVTPVPQVGFILSIKITIDPKNVEAFLGHFKPIYERCLAEPECVFFVIGQDPQEPGVFRWTEGWTKDAQWFMTVCFSHSLSFQIHTIETNINCSNN